MYLTLSFIQNKKVVSRDFKNPLKKVWGALSEVVVLVEEGEGISSEHIFIARKRGIDT